MDSRSTINYATFFLFLNRKYCFDLVFEFRTGICLPAPQKTVFRLLFFFWIFYHHEIWIRSYLIPQDLYISDCETVWEHFSSAILFAYFSRHTYWASCIGHAILWDMIFSALKMSCHLFRPYIPIYWCDVMVILFT